MSTASQKPLWQKLQVRNGMRLRLMNPPDGVMDGFAGLPGDISLGSEGVSGFDALLAFVASRADLAVLAEPCVRMLPHDGLLWFAFPKKSAHLRTDISRDVGWEPLRAMGLRPVRAISINARWSALRFRPADLVKPR